ncbi:MAG: septal ring lytic transglycosylase RlpA family protein [Candidatus Scalindua sp.]|nr:septal ring lytic transglycosylase RlpA family protein [Candidatus Scalindua sp.]
MSASDSGTDPCREDTDFDGCNDDVDSDPVNPCPDTVIKYFIQGGIIGSGDYLYMSIFQNMRIRKLLALCIGIICIVGCGRTNIRETNNKEVSRSEVGMRETVMKEDGRKEINMRESDISSTNLLEVPIKEEADKTKNNDKQPILYDEVGIASFISDEYGGKMTASGVRYDRNKMTAAHPSLPFDTKILVTNLRNKRKTEVIIIDRFYPIKDRILNVSHSAAVKLDLVESGIARVGIMIIANPD